MMLKFFVCMACLMMASGCSTTQLEVKPQLPKYDRSLLKPCNAKFVQAPTGAEHHVLTANNLNMEQAHDCAGTHNELVRQIENREKEGYYK